MRTERLLALAVGLALSLAAVAALLDALRLAIVLLAIGVAGVAAISLTGARSTRAAVDRVPDAVARRLRSLARSDAGSLPAVTDLRGVVQHELTRATRDLYEQVQATFNLFHLVDVTAPVPPLRGYAASPDALLHLIKELVRIRPRNVLDLGSGASTLFLALAAQRYEIDARIIGLDHDEEFAQKTRDMLRLHGVDTVAQVRTAPLTPVANHLSPGSDWYAPEALDDLSDIGLVFVDGPPGWLSEYSRYPALPHLWDKLSPTMSIVADDMIRDAEKTILSTWHAEHPELERIDVVTEKGLTILRRSSAD